jgi:hypothetical protein
MSARRPFIDGTSSQDLHSPTPHFLTVSAWTFERGQLPRRFHRCAAKEISFAKDMYLGPCALFSLTISVLYTEPSPTSTPLLPRLPDRRSHAGRRRTKFTLAKPKLFFRYVPLPAQLPSAVETCI